MIRNFKNVCKKIEDQYNWFLDVVAGPCDQYPLLGIAMLFSMIFLLTMILI